MNQVPLKLVQRLSYSPENFIIHSGVQSALQQVVEFSARPEFRICCVRGKARSGKTHFSLVLMDELGKRGLFPRLFEGAEFADAMHAGSMPLPDSSEQIFIIDDADHYLSSVKPGESGAFVRLVEGARGAGAGLVLMTSLAPSELPCDDHAQSRLRAGLHCELADPSDTEIPDIIHSIAKQRGLFLDARTTNFLQRRLPRDIPAIELYVQRLNHLSQVLGKTIRFPLISDAL